MVNKRNARLLSNKIACLKQGAQGTQLTVKAVKNCNRGAKKLEYRAKKKNFSTHFQAVIQLMYMSASNVKREKKFRKYKRKSALHGQQKHKTVTDSIHN